MLKRFFFICFFSSPLAAMETEIDKKKAEDAYKEQLVFYVRQPIDSIKEVMRCAIKEPFPNKVPDHFIAIKETKINETDFQKLSAYLAILGIAQKVEALRHYWPRKCEKNDEYHLNNEEAKIDVKIVYIREQLLLLRNSRSLFDFFKDFFKK